MPLLDPTQPSKHLIFQSDPIQPMPDSNSIKKILKTTKTNSRINLDIGADPMGSRGMEPHKNSVVGSSMARTPTKIS